MRLRRVFIRFIGLILIFAALTSSLLTAVDFASFSRSFYARSYRDLDTASKIGISQEDLDAATEQLLSYIQGEEKTLDIEVEIDAISTAHKVPMFNQREVDHMLDVQILYLKAIRLRNILISLCLILMTTFAALRKISPYRKDYQYFKQGLIGGIGLFTFLIVLIAAYAALDFESFWTNFHLLFFRNDLWILNPLTDRLIMMVPSAFFSALVRKIILTCCAALLFIAALSLGITQYLYRIDEKHQTK